MKTRNIFDTFSFTKEKQKTALDYLNELKSPLVAATAGELRLEIDAISLNDSIIAAAAYILYIVAPNLGNYRRKILSVHEYSNRGRFPVDIINAFESNHKLIQISEENFEKEISNIILSPIIKYSIESLYQESKNK